MPYKFKILIALLLFSLVLFAEKKTGDKIAVSALQQIGITNYYDPSYKVLKFPGGDVAKERGVCTDVVIRALRSVGIDLQKEINDDMKKNFSLYPQKWGLSKPDKNIDHRRVPNQMKYFERQNYSVKEDIDSPASYQPGDIVAWHLGNGRLHIGIVSVNKENNIPKIVHNIGNGTEEENLLFELEIIGHYRIKLNRQG